MLLFYLFFFNSELDFLQPDLPRKEGNTRVQKSVNTHFILGFAVEFIFFSIKWGSKTVVLCFLSVTWWAHKLGDLIPARYCMARYWFSPSSFSTIRKSGEWTQGLNQVHKSSFSLWKIFTQIFHVKQAFWTWSILQLFHLNHKLNFIQIQIQFLFIKVQFNPASHYRKWSTFRTN